ncbi:MAG TPA: NlpC/P60 family protein, partial [Acidimicrobiales bacterium]|nr:NlpC/P60 family protein [Acidimicrobiales bacterium]
MISLMAAGGLAATVGLGGSPPARADTIAATQARANQIAAEIEALGSKESALSQQYDGAVLHSQQLSQAISQDQARLAADSRREQSVRAQLRQAAVRAFVMGDQSPSVLDLVQGTGRQLADRAEYLKVATSQDADLVDQLHRDQDAVASEQARLQAEQAQARDAMASIAAARQQASQTEGQLQGLLSQVKGQLAAEVAAVQAAQQQAQAQAARARLAQAAAAARPAGPAVAAVGGGGPAPPSPPGGGGGFRPPPVPVSGGAATAVAVAEAQVGKPYVWGAAGPGAFDCSGLVMYAWAAAGVHLDHYTVAQYDET